MKIQYNNLYLLSLLYNYDTERRFENFKNLFVYWYNKQNEGIIYVEINIYNVLINRL